MMNVCASVGQIIRYKYFSAGLLCSNDPYPEHTKQLDQRGFKPGKVSVRETSRMGAAVGIAALHHCLQQLLYKVNVFALFIPRCYFLSLLHT